MTDDEMKIALFEKALEKLPIWKEKKKIFEKLAEMGKNKDALSPEEREKYEESRKVADDWYSGLYGAWLKGYEAGLNPSN